MIRELRKSVAILELAENWQTYDKIVFPAPAVAYI
jgi:hypothetical protein